MWTRGVEAKISDGVAGEGLDYPEAIEVFIHAVKIPESHVVVESSGGHSVTFGVDHAAGNGLGVSAEGGVLVDRNAQLVPLQLLLLLLGLGLDLGGGWLIVAALDVLEFGRADHLL